MSSISTDRPEDNSDNQPLSIQTLRVAVERVHETCELEAIEKAFFLRDSMRALLADLEQELDRRACEYIAEHGDFTLGATRYYVGPKKTTKLRKGEAGRALELALDAARGDTALACERYLSSQPFKYGALRDPLGPKWDECFEVIEEPELKEGKPKLNKLDTRYLR